MSEAAYIGSLGSSLLFYLFSGILTLTALGVILARNPVHAVLFLILSFLNAAGLFVILQAELVAMLLIIVYVGAVAVLFLFVVMMLDINFRELRQGMAKYIPFAILSGLVIAVELSAVGLVWMQPTPAVTPEKAVVPELTNTQAIGNVLYTDYFLIFQLAGIILLVAMIGAIVLTLRKRVGVLRQDVRKQIERTPQDTLTLHKVQSGKGVRL